MLFFSVTCKGIEQGTGKRMRVLLAEGLPGVAARLCVLSGPNLAREVIRDLPTSTVVASANDEAAREAQDL